MRHSKVLYSISHMHFSELVIGSVNHSCWMPKAKFIKLLLQGIAKHCICKKLI